MVGVTLTVVGGVADILGVADGELVTLGVGEFEGHAKHNKYPAREVDAGTGDTPGVGLTAFMNPGGHAVAFNPGVPGGPWSATTAYGAL